MLNIILFGPPGVGKGTQCTFLKDRGYIHLSTGDLIRLEIAAKTPLGNQVSAIVKKGEFLEDSLVMELVKAFLKKQGNIKGVLYDGIPRTLCQARLLDDSLASLNEEVTIAINLTYEKEVLKDRIVNRYLCGDCGSVFNALIHKNVEQKVCTNCGGSLSQRADDTLEVFEKRMALYQKNMKELLDFYNKKGLLIDVNGMESAEIVRENIYKSIECAIRKLDVRENQR